MRTREKRGFGFGILAFSRVSGARRGAPPGRWTAAARAAPGRPAVKGESAGPGSVFESPYFQLNDGFWGCNPS